MNLPESSPRLATLRDLIVIGDSQRWPVWPFLPLVRRHDDKEVECGLLYDFPNTSGRTGYRATVFLSNLFFVPET